MPKRILKVIKRMGDGLAAANTGGAMNTTEQKKRILLKDNQAEKQPVSKKKPKTPKTPK